MMWQPRFSHWHSSCACILPKYCGASQPSHLELLALGLAARAVAAENARRAPEAERLSLSKLMQVSTLFSSGAASVTNPTTRRLQVLYVPCRRIPRGSVVGGKKSSLSEVQARGLLWQSGVRGANDAGLLVKPLLPDLELASRALCAPVKLLQKDVLRVEAVNLLGVRLRDDHLGILSSHVAV